MFQSRLLSFSQVLSNIAALDLQHGCNNFTMWSSKVYKIFAMAKRSRFNELVRTVTRDVVEHPRDLTRHYAERLSISRVAANNYIQRLETEGWIARSGPSTHPVFSPGYRRRISRLYDLSGLEEHVAWERDFKPYLNLSGNVCKVSRVTDSQRWSTTRLTTLTGLPFCIRGRAR